MQLGALGFEVRDVGAWRAFLTEVIGLVEGDDLRFRMDEHGYRIQLREGPADDLAFLAWETDDATLDVRVDRLRTARVGVTEAEATGVRRRFLFADPSGIPTELVSGAALAPTPFRSPVVPSGFVADDLGLGHIVLTAKDKATSVQFYTDNLGFRLSDHIVCEMYGYPVDLSFFHANARHHSVAFGAPLPHRLHHFMIEARDLDDVGLAHDRTLKFGLPIMNTPGRHPNDRMFSFYAKTPSGFQFEFGWGGRRIDDEEAWRPTTYDRVSEWGHHAPMLAYGRKR
jgi:biphenyl-2,3-diol 1,2-dioxygenase